MNPNHDKQGRFASGGDGGSRFTIDRDAAGAPVIDDRRARVTAAALAAKAKLEPAKILTSHGNPNWMREKIAYVRGKGRNEWGAPERLDSETAYFNRDLELPTEMVASLPGYQGEHTRPMKQDSVDWLKPRMERGEDVGEIRVVVGHDGKAWIFEGNHRAKIAAMIGRKTVKVSVGYFDGGDLIADKPPKELQRIDREIKEKRVMRAAALGILSNKLRRSL